MLVYRITQTRYAYSLTASGVYGRWNSAGQQMLYTGGSAALSCLEVAVHKAGASLTSGDFSLSTIAIPEGILIEEILLADLVKEEKNWTDVIHYPMTQRLGDDWLNSASSAILKVPSAIIQNEFNYLLNVNHPDFQEIKIVTVNKFSFDVRLKTDAGA